MIEGGVSGWRRLLFCVALSLGALLLLVGKARASVPANLQPPTISGTAQSMQTLSASTGAWANDPTEYSYRWESCKREGTACLVWSTEGTSDSSYVVKPQDVGATIRVRVKARNVDGWSDFVASAMTAEVRTAWRFVAGPPRVERAHWYFGLTRGSGVKGHTATIGISSGFCLGEPRPVIDHIKLVERPKTAARPYGSAVITAFVRFPAPTEVVGPIYDGEPIPGCAGLGYRLNHRIRFKRPLDRLILFDGSFSPPRRIRTPKTAQGLATAR